MMNGANDKVERSGSRLGSLQTLNFELLWFVFEDQFRIFAQI